MMCDEKFQNVQYDEHCNSYAHHHKIRFKEKGLRKAAKAAGVKLNTVTPVVGMISTTKNSAVITATPGTEPGPGPSEKKSGFTVGGWSTVNSSSSGGGFKKPGWIIVSSPPKPGSPPPHPPPEPPHATTVPPPTHDIHIKFQER